MPITRTNMIDDDGSGKTGTIINNAWKQELYGQIDPFVERPTVQVPYSAANFLANAGSWTTVPADQHWLEYAVVGNSVVLQFHITGTITNACSALYIVVPGIPDPIRAGVAINSMAYFLGVPTGAAVVATGTVFASGGTYFSLGRDASGLLWTPNTMAVQGQLVYPWR